MPGPRPAAGGTPRRSPLSRGRLPGGRPVAHRPRSGLLRGLLTDVLVVPVDVLAGPGRLLHGADDALVTGAPAQVAGQAGADLLVARVRVRLEERRGGHDEPGGTETTLEAVALPEGPLHRGQGLGVRGQPLDRGDLRILHLDAQHQAGTNCLPVDEDGAGTADAVLAAEVCAGQPEVFAQGVGEGLARL